MPAPEDAARPIRERGRIGPLSLRQVLITEIAVLATVAATTQGLGYALVTALIGGAVATVFLARRDGRWWLEHRRLTRLFRHRRAAAAVRDAAAQEAAGPVLAALRTIAPGLAVDDVAAPDGTRAGVARDEAGWFCVVALTPPATHRDAPDRPDTPAHPGSGAAPVPLRVLTGVLAAAGQQGVVLQLVTHTVPAPSPDVHVASPAGMSYRRLLETLSPVPVPAHRESTVSIRVDARILAEALLDHTADPEAAATMVAGLGRKVAAALHRTGAGCRLLNADELLAALARSCDVEPGAFAEGAQRVGEEWTHWRSARLVHRTYWLKTWPAPAARIESLLAWAATAPASMTSVTLIVSAIDSDTTDNGAIDSGTGDNSTGDNGTGNGDGTGNGAGDGDGEAGNGRGGSSARNGGAEVAVRAFVRLAARPDADLAALDRVLQDGVRRAGAELSPLDGEQGPAAYATAPTGGGAG
ncbi:type VII secretion protein EccE [Actinoplanes sp. NPDC051851]|uniref:type VII secretion protein EccE n=1 Tax=Actinoplanes sp. NPDC051851 TaxID=3154753 RepID=UPI003447A91D